MNEQETFYAEGRMPVEAVLLRAICESTPDGSTLIYTTDHSVLKRLNEMTSRIDDLESEVARLRGALQKAWNVALPLLLDALEQPLEQGGIYLDAIDPELKRRLLAALNPPSLTAGLKGE